MLLRAYAKINISLDVVGKREDGYHLLEMIMQNIDLYDVIDMKKSDSGIKLNCNKQYVPKDERNLAYKAAKLFIDEYNVKSGIEIDIVKNIPVAAGLAGGSADAAAVLKGMRDMFCPQVSDSELMKLGLRLGADVPYCVLGGTALCKGIGEVIIPMKPFRNYILVLVKPNFGVSTKDVYMNIDIDKIKKHPETELIIKAMSNNNIINVGRKLKNVLENVTLKRYGVLKKIKDQMLEMGSCGALMSGSGPSVYGFFEDMLTAQRCFEKLKKNYEEVFITRTI